MRHLTRRFGMPRAGRPRGTVWFFCGYLGGEDLDHRDDEPPAREPGHDEPGDAAWRRGVPGPEVAPAVRSLRSRPVLLGFVLGLMAIIGGAVAARLVYEYLAALVPVAAGLLVSVLVWLAGARRR